MIVVFSYCGELRVWVLSLLLVLVEYIAKMWRYRIHCPYLSYHIHFPVVMPHLLELYVFSWKNDRRQTAPNRPLHSTPVHWLPRSITYTASSTAQDTAPTKVWNTARTRRWASTIDSYLTSRRVWNARSSLLWRRAAFEQMPTSE